MCIRDRDEEYRFNDISVITKDLEGYANLCKAIFAKYNIPTVSYTHLIRKKKFNRKFNT